MLAMTHDNYRAGKDTIISCWDLFDSTIVLHRGSGQFDSFAQMFSKFILKAYWAISALMFLVLPYEKILFLPQPSASKYRITFANSGRVAKHNNWFQHSLFGVL